MISIEQIKAARALLGWTQEELANRAGLSKPAVNTLERRIANPKVETMSAIQKAMEEAGVAFTDGPGVKLVSSVIKTEVWEGENALLRLVQDIYDTLNRSGGRLMISGVEEKRYKEFGGPLILKEIDKRLKAGIDTRLLIQEGDKDLIEPVDHYRWIPKAFFPKTPTYIYDDKYAILLWGPPKKVVLVKNKEIAESFAEQFLALWEAGQKPEL